MGRSGASWFSQIRYQAILIALLPLAVLAIMLAYTLGTRATTRETAYWANHTRDVLAKSDALYVAISNASHVLTTYNSAHKARDTAAFIRAQHAISVDGSALLAAATAQTDEQDRAQAFVQVANQSNAFLNRYFAALRTNDVATQRAMAESPATARLTAAIRSTKNALDDTERTLATTYLATSSVRLAHFTDVLVVTLIAGIVLFLVISIVFGTRVALRAQQLRRNAGDLREGRNPTPLEGNDELAVAEHEYRTVLEQWRREHSNATVLQRALLPQKLPLVPGVRIDASYTPSASGTDVGGDWYDVFMLGDGRLGISVGDVAGHGLQAASLMSLMRHSVRMAARLYEEPSEVVAAVNRVACEDGGPLVTLFYGELSLTTGLLRYASAGHPMPITVRATGNVEQIAGGGLIMGADRRADYRQHSMTLDAGSALVLFTDGLIETGRKPSTHYDAGLNRLVDVVNRQYYSATENIAHAIQRDVLEGRPPIDDAAVLFIAVTDVGFTRANTTKTWNVDARSAAAARRAKRAFLWHLGEFAPDGTDLSGAELIFGELVGNVVRHTPGSAEITLEIIDSDAFLHVADEGPPIVHAAGAPEDFAESGRGLLLVESLARSLTIERMRNGNRVTAELPLRLDRRDQGREAVRASKRRTKPNVIVATSFQS